MPLLPLDCWTKLYARLAFGNQCRRELTPNSENPSLRAAALMKMRSARLMSAWPKYDSLWMTDCESLGVQLAVFSRSNGCGPTSVMPVTAICRKSRALMFCPRVSDPDTPGLNVCDAVPVRFWSSWNDLKSARITWPVG